MTAVALSLVGSPSRTQELDPAVPRRSFVVLSAILIGLAFFLAGHDLRVSLAESYTQNAEQMEIAAAGGNALRRVAFLGLAGWGFLLLVVGKDRLRLNPVLAASIATLLAVAGASFVWADEPGMCLRRLLILVCCTTAAGGIARFLRLREICWLSVVVLGGLAVIGLLAEAALGTFRPWASDYRFAGTVHPNTQGPALAMVCLAAFGIARDGGGNRIWPWMTLAIAFGLLLLTKSRTATAAIVVSLAAVQFLRTPFSLKLAGLLGMAWLGAAGLWSLWVCGFEPLSDFRDALLLGRSDDSDTLSGRAFIWPEVISYIRERFWLGYGYESFWTAGRIETISDRLGWGLREAHNAYLETLLALGAAGLLSLLGVAFAGLASAIRGWRRSGDPAHALPAGMIVFAVINAGFESGMVAITLVPFLLGCTLLRLAFFREEETQ